MAFHDVRLPEDIERGFEGGPGLAVNIATSDSGFERRNQRWTDFRRNYTAGYGLQLKEQYEVILIFFHSRRGQTHSFPFRDWFDYELDRQIIGQTDGSTATFQIFKEYDSGGFPYNRDIEKPVTATTRVWVDNVEINQGAGGSEFQVDRLTGIVTLGATLAAQSGTDVECETEFDTPVRFDVSQLSLSMEIEDAGAVPNFGLIEVRGE